jgi:hypothetical protein
MVLVLRLQTSLLDSATVNVTVLLSVLLVAAVRPNEAAPTMTSAGSVKVRVGSALLIVKFVADDET